MNAKLQTVVTAAMLAAMTTVATLMIRIPTIGTNGYINTGDAVVLISAWLLGNPYGALAAGAGSALADLFAGYPAYIPGTAIIKYLMAFVAAIVFKRIEKMNLPKTAGFQSDSFTGNLQTNSTRPFKGGDHTASYLISSVAAEAVMVSGYFLYEWTILGYGPAAAASIGSNAIQGVTCIVLGNALIRVLSGLRKSFSQQS